MCTVSWTHTPGGYHLLCNRDELRSRGVAAAPGRFETGGTRYLAPADADQGGTWIAVNEHGVGLCLLNGRRGDAAGGGRSRGFVVPELIWLRSVDDCGFVLGQMDLTCFAPFTLLMLEPSSAAAVAAWDGRCLAIDRNADGRAPLVSSSHDPEGVRRSRVREFAKYDADDPASLYRFHSAHGDGPDAYSPCMHRSDAETVSFSWVVVTPGELRFLYVPAAPCLCTPGERSMLARTA